MYAKIHYADDMPMVSDDPTTYTTVWEGELGTYDTDTDTLEYAYAVFNRGSGREHVALDTLDLRSMTAGDVVQLVTPSGKRFYRCDPRGWTPVEGVRANDDIDEMFDAQRRRDEMAEALLPLDTSDHARND